MSIQNSLRVRGVTGTAHLALLRLFNFKKTPEHLLSRMLDLKRYDRAHNVQTSGLIELDQLDIASESKKHGTRYGGATPWRFQDIMEHIPIDHQKYRFIDIGSGKGAALFFASDYPFKEIIGVEFAPALHEAALRNIATFQSKSQKCHRIEAICGDGGKYEYPPGPWVLFFNSPFGVPIWKEVAANIARAAKCDKSYLIFMNYGWIPEARRFVEGLGLFQVIFRDDVTQVFEILPSGREGVQSGSDSR